MNIKLNINILNRFRGDVIAPDSRDYEQFKMWAENKDIKMGVVICEFVSNAPAAENEAEASPLGRTTTVAEADAVEQVAQPEVERVKCRYCDAMLHPKGVNLHVGKYHKAEHAAATNIRVE